MASVVACEWLGEIQQDWWAHYQFFIIAFRLEIVVILILIVVLILVSISFDTTVQYLLLGVRDKYLSCFLLSSALSSLRKVAPNMHKCLFLKRRCPFHLYWSFLLKPINHGFPVPRHCGWCWSWRCWESLKSPGGTCRGPFIAVHAVTSFDFHGDCLLSLLPLGLALCWKFFPHTEGLLWTSCLFVCLSVFVL